MIIGNLGYIAFFLLGTSTLTVVNACLREIRKRASNKTLKDAGPLFFYAPFQRFFFKERQVDTLYFATGAAKSICAFFYGASVIAFLLRADLFPFTSTKNIFWAVIYLCGFVLTALVVGDFLPRAFAAAKTKKAFKITAPVASIFLIAFFPVSFLFLKLSRRIIRLFGKDHPVDHHSHFKEKIVGILQDSISSSKIDASDTKLLESVVSFKDRIVREVMVPRVNVFSLDGETKVEDAARLCLEEGFSRIPVYKDSIDNIIGVLMYKDLLALYSGKDRENFLKEPIKKILKPVFFTPETKKISSLLQEFRKKQTHLAIVVDEYGGTEGIVTIEDILEEIVGEIEDEYDDEPTLFTELPHGGWMVDARMSILDIDEQLGIKIPQDGEYDTIGGYVFHRAGSIPEKGLLIHHDHFELEILSSNERSIKKVRITPLSPTSEEDTKMQDAL